MTEIDALKKTVVVWRFIVDHPTCSKALAYRLLNLEPDIFFCPLCEYARPRKLSRSCQKCPLINFWPEPWNVQAPCHNLGSPYKSWLINGQTKHARQIITAAEARLKELLS